MSVGNAFIVSLVQVFSAVLNAYVWIIIAGAVLSWLVSFGILNRYNRAVTVIIEMITRITEPLLRPIRRVLPNTGMIDFSPLVLILIIFFIQTFIHNLMR